MKYFAYGSNMLTRRLTARSRAPSAVARGVAAVSGFAVRFHKVGADGSGKCTLVETEEESAVAYGVLYELEDSDGDKLDRVRAGKRVCTRAATAGVPFSFVSSTAAPPML
jgi:gamma-glutamylcyclotransferase